MDFVVLCVSFFDVLWLSFLVELSTLSNELLLRVNEDKSSCNDNSDVEFLKWNGVKSETDHVWRKPKIKSYVFGKEVLLITFVKSRHSYYVSGQCTPR